MSLQDPSVTTFVVSDPSGQLDGRGKLMPGFALTHRSSFVVGQYFDPSESPWVSTSVSCRRPSLVVHLDPYPATEPETLEG